MTDFLLVDLIECCACTKEFRVVCHIHIPFPGEYILPTKSSVQIFLIIIAPWRTVGCVKRSCKAPRNSWVTNARRMQFLQQSFGTFMYATAAIQQQPFQDADVDLWPYPGWSGQNCLIIHWRLELLAKRATCAEDTVRIRCLNSW